MTAQPLITHIEKERNVNIKKATEFTTTDIENRNAIAATKTAHFPRNREVEEVVVLL